MKHQRQELTLKNALTDPLVQTMMAADGVDPEELSSMLHAIVSMLDRRARHQPLRDLRSSLSATICA
jgi:hypothetical protein